MSKEPAAIPRATYRVQLNSDFTFRDAEQLVPYFDELGISHLYTSPFLKARRGSTHGYDVTDHNTFNPEVGDENDFSSLASVLREHKMGQILDFVPNHMGIGMADNDWWLDVLEWGQASPYADYFDIDWNPATAILRDKVLLPFLGDAYGKVLEEGQLKLQFDEQKGSFSVTYYEHLYPIYPPSYVEILSAVVESTEQPAPGLNDLFKAFGALRVKGHSRSHQRETRARAESLKGQLADLASHNQEITKAINTELALYNGVPGRAKSFVRLHRLLEKQWYRLAFWRVATEEINYRRFFDINDLAGIKVEHKEVFDNIHRLIFKLIKENKLQGLRIDHIDGLYDPHQYCARLQKAFGSSDPEVGHNIYLLVEKILAGHEKLRNEWPVAGTTGYEVLNHINGLFVDTAAKRPLEVFYFRFTGCRESFEKTLLQSKRRVVNNLLASELQVLANGFDRLAETNWSTRDFTLPSLHAALSEIVVQFPVYRTYVTASGANSADYRDIDWAIGRAKRSDPFIDQEIFNFIRGVLTTELARRGRGYNRNEVIRLAMRFQQYTSPVMAKSLEDTTLYRYVPLVSLNEVGGEPDHFGDSVKAFHHFISDRHSHWPNALVTTDSHDSKRGEDVRARLNALTEMTAEWQKGVRHWARLNRRKRRLLEDGLAPSRNDEYLLYQTLVGSWPASWMGGEAPSGEELDRYKLRIQEYMIKAIREAKTHSSWLQPNEDYEKALCEFIGQLLKSSNSPFILDFSKFMEKLGPFGMINGLAQTVLKFTLPGVPDIYQGSEFWDLNLVDPDNRRPVDYQARSSTLKNLKSRAKTDCEKLIEELLDQWIDGRLKLFLMWRLLDLRRLHVELFEVGSYQPLEVTGRHAASICAFARNHEDSVIITVVPCRKPPSLLNLGSGANTIDWGDAQVVLPDDYQGGKWRNIFNGGEIECEKKSNTVGLSSLFRELPVVVLEGVPEK